MTGSWVAILAAGLIVPGAVDAEEIDCAGRWYTEDQKSIVEIFDCGDGTPCGRVAWIDPDQDNIFVDNRNRDPELRGRPLEGAIILQGFEADDAGWNGGKIYNPENGKSYFAKMHLEDDGSLTVKGCVGPICKGLHWTEAP